MNSMDSFSVTFLQARFYENLKFPLVRVMGGLYFASCLVLTVRHPFCANSLYS